MSGSVESRVVSMKFDNSDFGSKIAATLAALEKLKNGLKMTGATKGLTDISDAAGKTNLSPISASLDHVSGKFLALSTVAITALSQITSRALTAGTQLVKSLSLAPVMDGFHEYETNMNAIQTILANTGLEGASGMSQVNKALNDLNTYSDKTIYNFSEMAKNIGTFTSAGVDLKTSTAAIKGIANLAAVSGSNSEQASTAMYQLSQAMASGTVKLQDWNSVVNAGMGGKVFQTALKDTARSHGVAVDEMIKKDGSFRESLKEGWVTSTVLTDTLKKFTGDLSLAQIKQMGYSDKQAAAILKMGKTAQDAATKVKTLSQLQGTLKEAMGSGWTQTWSILFGNFNEAEDMFTGVSNVLGGLISNSANARNKLLGDWKAMGGRAMLIQGITNAFHSLQAILKPIREAFRDVFPKQTAVGLYNMTVEFAHLMAAMKPSAETAKSLKNIFHGIFAVFDIVKQVIFGVAAGIAKLFSSTGAGSGGFLKFLGSIGSSVYNFDLFLKKTGAIEKFFTTLGGFLALPIRLIGKLASGIGELFSRFDTKKSGKLNETLQDAHQRMNQVQTAGDKLKAFFERLGNVFSNAGTAIGNAISKIGDALAGAFTEKSFNHILDLINTGLLAGIVYMLKKFTAGGLKVNVGDGIFMQIKKSLFDVTQTMKVMQQQLKAKMLLEIAGAIAVLAVSILILSTIDPKKLAVSMAAIVVGFGMLQGALMALDKFISGKAAVKLPFITAALIGLSTAILLMALALKLMASIKPEDTARALLTMTVALTAMTKSMNSLSKNSGGNLRAAASMILLAIAMNAIAVALKIFATMSWDDMAHGLAAMAGALIIMAGAMRLMPTNMLLQAAALVAVGVALNAIAAALKIFATFSWKEMAHGLVAMAGALLIIAGAMQLMPPEMILQAAGLVAVGVALNIIAGALALMGKMGWGEIAKSMVVLAGSLAILAAGLYLMTGSLLGSAALVVAAAALAIMTPVLIALGSLEWMTILKGLAALAGIFVVLGVAGLVLAPVVPAILGLSAALILLGAGLALMGAGAFLFATAFGIVVATGSAGIKTLQEVFMTLQSAIPQMLIALAKGIGGFALEIAKHGPEFVVAMDTIIHSILTSIIKNVPLFGVAFLTIITTALRVLQVAIPRMANAGLNILLAVLTAISKNIYRIVTVAANIIINFMQGIQDNLPRVIQKAAEVIIAFINGLANAIRDNSDELGAAGGNLAEAIVEGMIKGLGAGAGKIADAAKNAAKGALKGAMHMLGINSPSKEFHKIGEFSSLGLANGISALAHVVTSAARDVASTALEKIRASMSKVHEAVSGDMNINPVIAPVIDLTQFRKDAGKMTSMMDVTPISASVSYTQAMSISSDQQEAQDNPDNGPVEPLVLKFEQNNHSPEALSTTEIYRRTNNQLSLAKKALGLPDAKSA